MPQAQVQWVLTLEEAHIGLEKQVAEAMVVWDDDFRNFAVEISDVEHIARCDVLTGAASIDTRRSKADRAQSAGMYHLFQADVHGYNDERRSLSDRLSKAEKLLLEILRSKRLA